VELLQLGVLKAFETRADFSGIIDNRSDMYISVILQKTFIHLDEQGIGTDESSELSR
jgi:serine protease inhibitor